MTPTEHLLDLYAQQHFYLHPNQGMKITYDTFRDGRQSIKNIKLPAQTGTWRKLDPIDKKPYLDMARKELEGMGVELVS
jgi:hypothetical protein